MSQSFKSCGKETKAEQRKSYNDLKGRKISKNNEEKNFLNPFCVPALSKSILS
jgi:hypothetical protein